jgi:integrase
MKRTSTKDTGGSGQVSHGLTFAKVVDGRKQPIRGLWIRGDRFYAQLTIENPVSGEKRVRRVPLVDQENNAVTTVAQAQAAMDRLKVKRADNDLPTLRRTPKFADYAKTYIDSIKLGEGAKKAGSIAKDESALARWVEHLGPNLRVDQIKPAHINAFKQKRLAIGLKNRTFNLDVISLRCCLKQAREDGWLQRLPTDGLQPLQTTTPKRPLFTTADLDKICNAAFEQRKNEAGELVPVTKNAQQFVDYIRLLAYCGARRNEALALRWSDVQFDNAHLTIGSDGNTKNSEARTVDFNPKLEAHLKAMKARGKDVSEFLFPSPQRGDKDASTKTFKESLNLVRAHAKMPKFNFHDCRHHFISMCVMAGIDFMTIAAWVGHKDGGVLIGKVYGHLANEHKKAMAAKLNFEPVVLTAVNH